MPPVVFDPTISAGERPQTYALDRAAIGTGSFTYMQRLKDGGIGFRRNVSCNVLICMESHSRKL